MCGLELLETREVLSQNVKALSEPAGAYALGTMISTLDDLDRYQRWARFWDARHAQIVSERRAGAGAIEVVLMDHIIPDVAELQPDPNYFYNNCAEWYYDIQSLAANQSGWDE